MSTTVKKKNTAGKHLTFLGSSWVMQLSWTLKASLPADNRLQKAPREVGYYKMVSCPRKGGRKTASSKVLPCTELKLHKGLLSNIESAIESSGVNQGPFTTPISVLAANAFLSCPLSLLNTTHPFHPSPSPIPAPFTPQKAEYPTEQINSHVVFLRVKVYIYTHNKALDSH